jgi:pimeloyl-ACP methyl ester carboxylesterase
LALADSLGISAFDFCGLSLGGMTGMRIAAQTRGRLRRLVLANTSAKFPDPGPMETRRKTVLADGMAAVGDAVMDRFLRKAVQESGNPHAATLRTVLLATDPVGYAAACGAVRDLDNRDLLPKIDVPVLIISSEIDQSTPWKGHGDLLAERIPQAEVLMLETAHLSNIEAPREFAEALIRFLVK